jgi:[ribosomal protein S5]-alanine N-acetyltransferase
VATPRLERYAFAMRGSAFVAVTPRLRLRTVELADAAFLKRLLNEPSWLENIGDRGVRSEADAVSYIRDQIWSPYRALGYGMYLVRRREDDIPIGICGLVKRDFLAHPDLGFALLPEHVGQGYAAEAARSVVAAAGSRWGIAQLHAITNLGNHRAVRLLERLEFHRERSCTLPQGGEVELYATAVRGAG